MPFAWDELPEDLFFREYWRKKPVLIKGGAKQILDFEVEVPFFRRVCQKLDRSPLALVNREPGFIFAQKMDEAEPRFRAISRRYEQRMSVRRVWFDGVYTTDTHTIGCHYDHSDNFVLQQSGTKHWKLASPKMIPPAELRERMLESREVGHIHMPDECEDFLLEASDVLYIPLFWAHWGVSHGTAMSVSLVLNADAPVDVTASPLRRVLSALPSWVEPLPAMPRPSPDAPISPEVGPSLDRMIDAMNAPETRAALRAALWQELFIEAPKESAAPESPGASPYGSKIAERRPESIALPHDRLRVIVEAELVEPSVSELLEPSLSTSALLAHFGQRRLDSALSMLTRASTLFPEASAWPAIIEGFTDLASRPTDEALRLVLAPELAAWVWRAEEAVGFTYFPRFEEVTADFGAIYGRAVSAPSRDELWMGAEYPWLLDHYPKGRRYGGRRLDRRPEARARLRERLRRLREQCSSLDAELSAEITLLLRSPMAMEPTADGAATHSIEPLFGTLLIDPERAELPDLVFEAGRTKARVIVQVAELVRADVRQRLTSPFDRSEMSTARLFVEAFGHRYRSRLDSKVRDPRILEALSIVASSPALSEAGHELLGSMVE